MSKWVQKLVEAPCPGLQDGTSERSWHVGASLTLHPEGIEKDCPTCHGSGALVPKLRQECPSHKANRIGHETLGDAPLEHPCRPQCGHCQGRGWELIPEAEVMGVLVRVAKTFSITIAETVTYIHSNQQEFVADGPEEALAHAIGQATGVV